MIASIMLTATQARSKAQNDLVTLQKMDLFGGENQDYEKISEIK